jgi:endonuclease/exonuclease/phosphatase family metal-dependent hydrolase
MNARFLVAAMTLILAAPACSADEPLDSTDLDAAAGSDTETGSSPDSVDLPTHDAGPDADAASEEPDSIDLLDASPPATFTVVTFNTGTGPEGIREQPGETYGPEEAAITDEHYGNGLNWPPLVEEVGAFFADVDADVVAFQEIFWSGECPSIPVDARRGFICEDWAPGDPTVAQLVLGAGWQIACHPGNPDKCLAVRESFGRFRDCDEPLCLEGLVGFRVDGCGSAPRVARGVIERAAGDPLTVVSVHGTSGLTYEEADCRVRQVEQVFVDLGDGEPGANGTSNLVLGDLNTDPGRMQGTDASAARWNDFVGPERPFAFVSDVGRDATPTYAGLFNIDHVVSDTLRGSCWVAGFSPGRPPVSTMRYLDHAPVVCEVAP